MSRPPEDAPEETDDGLFLLLPHLEGADDQRSHVVGGGGVGELVGVVVRGAPERVEGIPLPARDPLRVLETVNVLLATARNGLVHPQRREGDASSKPMAITDLPVYINPGGGTEQDVGTMSLALLDTLIETTETQLMLLRQIRAASASSRRERVTLQTPTGPLEYTLPLSRDDTYSSTAVSEILSPTGKGHRTVAQHRRRGHELLGIKIGNQYRYPKFQIDPVRHEIRPIVAYANRRMECGADPWGTLDWWYSEDEALDGRRPVDMLDSGELTQKQVDFAIRHSQQAMD